MLDEDPFLSITDDIFSPSVNDLFSIENEQFFTDFTDSDRNNLNTYFVEQENDFSTMVLPPLSNKYENTTSSNSSDSGKHSPSGSESFSDQFSPLNYQCDPSTSYATPPYEEMHSESSMMYDASSTPISSPPSNFSCNSYGVPQSPQVASAPNSNSTARRFFIISPGAQNNFNQNVQPIYVKSNVQNVAPQNTTEKRIYINQMTGKEVKPLPVLVKPPVLPMKRTVNYVNNTADPYEEDRRRQEDRKLKNRAAAQVSRQKKKMEVEEYKSRIEFLEYENFKLAEENKKLRDRLCRYEPQPNPSEPPRKRVAIAGACLMAVFMVVTFSPIDLNSTSPPLAKHRAVPISYGHLLPVYDNETLLNVPSTFENITTSCGRKGFLNKTETIRLNADLYDWIDRHEQMDAVKKQGKRVLRKKMPAWPTKVDIQRVNITEDTNVPRNKSSKIEESRQRAIRDRAWKHLDLISESRDTLRDKRRKLQKLEKLTFSQATAEEYDRLASAVQQRNDTLYIVAMKDYLLLPALDRNSTSRPRLTLILPALAFNATMGENQISLMKIELDVVGTGLFNLSRKIFPILLN